ncbi:MAG: hypothetical protein ACM35H_10410 [Bacteroidota bacterium]|nr:hypothetical protein [Kiloniellaceae bacterium]
MTDEQEAPARLAFGATFRAAFASVFGNLWSFAKAALLPIALTFGLALVGFALLAADPRYATDLLSLALQLLGLLPLAILGIACHRLVLLGREAGAIPRPLVGRRTLVYLGYILLLSIVATLPGLLFSVVMLGDVIVSLEDGSQALERQDPARIGEALLLMFLFYFVYFYFLTRLSLVFPAVAVDRKLGFGGSWRLTRGRNGVKLYTLLIVVTLLCLIGMMIGMFVVNTLVALLWFAPDLAMSVDEINWIDVVISQLPNLIGALLFEFLCFALILAAVTTAYAQLSGWEAPHDETTGRFA